jgi:Zn-dependent M16 (insulinase) family peptidase
MSSFCPLSTKESFIESGHHFNVNNHNPKCVHPLTRRRGPLES